MLRRRSRVLQNKKRAVIDRAYSLENICSIVGAVYDRPLSFLKIRIAVEFDREPTSRDPVAFP